MGLTIPFSGWKLVIPVLSTTDFIDADLLNVLQKEFGSIDYCSDALPFAWTDYYTPEMGSPLYRFFLSFLEPIQPDRLAGVKQYCNNLELQNAPAEKRRINLDPGILNESRFLLATTKDRAHRIPLQNGIYAELTLLFTKKSAEPLPWTYPDYCSEEYHKIFMHIRSLFRNNLNKK